MPSRKLDSATIYGSRRQRIDRLLHLVKATYRAKERKRVSWLSRYISEAGGVLDVGAHFGYFTKEFATLHGGACPVHAFEPMSYNHAILTSVVSSHRNVTVNQVALSDSSGSIDLTIPVKRKGKIGPGLAHFGEESNRDYIVESVQTTTLDEYISKSAILQVDFIKIDVEGAELLVLRGGEEAIQTYHPTIYAEVNDQYTRRLGYQAQDIFQLLSSYGYTASRVDTQDAFSLVAVTNYAGAGDYIFSRPGG